MAKNFQQQLAEQRNKQIEGSKILEQKKQIDDLNKKISELQSIIKQKNNLDIDEVEISKIKIFNNIRNISRTEVLEFKELKESIEQFGQLQPILITSDFYLIAGERRLLSCKSLGYKTIKAYIHDKKLSEIEDELEIIQYQENEERKNLDNFDLCILFKKYSELGYSNKDIASLFKKDKFQVSKILSIELIDKPLIDYMKEFQLYGYSKEKYLSDEVDKNDKINMKNKGVIGLNILYSFTKKSIQEQKELFLKKFPERLTKEQINSEYFQTVPKEKHKNIQKESYNNLLKISEKLLNDEGFKNNPNYELVKEKLHEIQDLLR